MNTERRSNRCRTRSLATRFYLLNVARRHQPRAIALTDLQGQVLAGVEGRPFMEDGFIATRACERAERVITGLAQSVASGGSRRLSWADRVVEGFRSLRGRPTRQDFALDGVKAIERITVDGNELLLVVIGDDTGNAIGEAIAGIQRIYTAPVSQPEIDVDEVTDVEFMDEDQLIELHDEDEEPILH